MNDAIVWVKMQPNVKAYWVDKSLYARRCVSNNDEKALRLLEQWIQHIIRVEYAHRVMPFGKYKDRPMCEIPGSYFQWLVENDKCGYCSPILFKELELVTDKRYHYIFKTKKCMHYYGRIRDDHYRIKWDTRTAIQRIPILDSLLQRHWIDKIAEVVPDADGLVHGTYATDNPYLPHFVCSKGQEEQTKKR